MKNWLGMKQDHKVNESELQNAVKGVKENLGIISPQEAEGIFEASSFKKPVQFFQSLLIRAWYTQTD